MEIKRGYIDDGEGDNYSVYQLRYRSPVRKNRFELDRGVNILVSLNLLSEQNIDVVDPGGRYEVNLSYIFPTALAVEFLKKCDRELDVKLHHRPQPLLLRIGGIT
jgi:hypothetical protein